jgi:prolipoprotein diacylglyceryltransferase
MLTTFPVYLHFGSLQIHPHFVFETLGYLAGFRLYLSLRRSKGDSIPDVDRWWVIAAAAIGAASGSKLLFWFEDPQLTFGHLRDPIFLLGGKTIVGALAGSLLSVELVKKRLGITRRTGDLFAVPLCLGIAIGRIGCFLTGLEDHTTGIATSLPWGVNFGDGFPRHPTQLYEVFFALVLGMFLWRRMGRPHAEGDVFKMFMIAYMAFRFLFDFLKPDVRVILGLSSIQCVCVALLLYYSPDLVRWIKRSATPSDSLNAARAAEPAAESSSLSEETAP